MIPDTLEYIDLLFYNESSLIDDSDDYVNVLSNINKIYEKSMREVSPNCVNISATPIMTRTHTSLESRFLSSYC